ncbi:MmcQ/YjbR family DNA-binding protein [Paenibacillus sp. S-38]|uniref:MmcQ/YjbR family DNA-binding protein n=1 Tax=Paenibacillus sp. S-38 TaxID=3416710 RepID=UPI003CE8B835
MTDQDRMEEEGQRELLERIRIYCLCFPGTSERASHGAPTFYVGGKKSFAQYHNNHHQDGRIALWCAAAAGMQPILVELDPGIYFVPPYVGHLGWVGIRLDRSAGWDTIAGVIGDAYLARASKKYIESLRAERSV